MCTSGARTRAIGRTAVCGKHVHAVKLKALQPAARQFKLSDEHGLHVLVKPSGARCWRYKYRFAGKEKVLALGVYPEVSLKQAREAHQAARAMLREGKDPSAVKRQQAAERVAAGRNSFEAIARQWHAKTKVKWSDRPRRACAARDGAHFVPEARAAAGAGD